MEVITRKEALAAGRTHYFTGKPCNRGGVAPRAVSDKQCQCKAHRADRAANAHARYLKHRDYRLEKQRRYAAEHSDQVRANAAAHYKANRSAYLARARRHALAHRDRVRATARRWAKNNPDKAARRRRERQAAQINAMPVWYGEFDRLVMREAHDAAQSRSASTGVEHHVDHIIPLRAETACGLHAADNIQVIPATLNRHKSNRLELEVCH